MNTLPNFVHSYKDLAPNGLRGFIAHHSLDVLCVQARCAMQQLIPSSTARAHATQLHAHTLLLPRRPSCQRAR